MRRRDAVSLTFAEFHMETLNCIWQTFVKKQPLRASQFFCIVQFNLYVNWYPYIRSLCQLVSVLSFHINEHIVMTYCTN